MPLVVDSNSPSALPSVRTCARFFDLYLSYYSRRVILEAAATLLPSSWFRSWLEHSLVGPNTSCLFLEEARSKRLKMASAEEKEIFGKLVAQSSSEIVVLCSLLLQFGPSLFLSMLCYRGFLTTVTLPKLETTLKPFFRQDFKYKVKQNFYSLTTVGLRKADAAFFSFDNAAMSFVNFNGSRRFRKQPEVEWPAYCQKLIVDLYIESHETIEREVLECYEKELPFPDFVFDMDGMDIAPVVLAPPPPAAFASPASSLSLSSPTSYLTPADTAALGNFGNLFEWSGFKTDLPKLLPATYNSGSPLIRSGLLNYNLRPEGPSGVRAFLGFNKDNHRGTTSVVQRYIGVLHDASYAAVWGHAPLLEGPNASRVVINAIKQTSVDQYSAVFSQVINYLTFSGRLVLTNEATKEWEDQQAIHRALLLLSTNANPTPMRTMCQYIAVQFESANSSVICEKTVGSFSFLMSACINFFKIVWLYEKSRVLQADNEAGGVGASFLIGDSLKGVDAERMTLVMNGAMSQSASMIVLFTLRSYCNQFIGQNTLSYDVIINAEELEAGRLSMIIGGISMTSEGVGRIAEAMMKKCKLLAHQLFDGADKIADVQFSRFLNHALLINVDDANALKRASLSYVTSNGTPVSNKLLTAIFSTMMKNLSVKESDVYEQRYYELLNWLLALLGLITPNRATELSRTISADLAGGGVRQVRFYSNSRSKFGEVLSLIARQKEKFTGGDLAKDCVTAVPFCVVRLVLAVIVSREAFVELVQSRDTKRHRKPMLPRVHLASSLFVSDVGGDLRENDSFGAINFSKKVAIIVGELNSASRAAGVDGVADLVIFEQGDNRHFMQAAIDVMINLKKGSLAEKDLQRRYNEGMFGHSLETGKSYNNSAKFANSSLPTINSNDIESLLSIYFALWRMFGLEESTTYTKFIVKVQQFADVYGIADFDDDNAVDSKIKLFCKNHIPLLQRSVVKFDAGVIWREDVLAAVVNTLALDADLYEPGQNFALTRHLGIWLPVGSGKTVVPFFCALVGQLYIVEQKKKIVVVILPDNSLLMDMVSRAQDAGLETLEYHTSTAQAIMHGIRLGNVPSILFVVVDTFISKPAQKHFLELLKAGKLTRFYFDEAHSLGGDRCWRKSVLDVCALLRDDRYADINLSFMSGTMPPPLLEFLLSELKIEMNDVVCFYPEHSTPLKMRFGHVSFHKNDMRANILDACEDEVKGGGSIAVFCMSISDCNNYASALRDDRGIESVVNSSDERSSNTAWGDSMKSFLGATHNRIKVCFSTMPVSGLSPAKVHRVIVCGAFSLISLLQSLGRAGRDGGFCVSELWTTEEILSDMRRLTNEEEANELSKGLSVEARCRSVLNFVDGCQRGVCLRLMLAKATFVGEKLTCVELQEAGGVLCSVCREGDDESAATRAGSNNGELGEEAPPPIRDGGQEPQSTHRKKGRDHLEVGNNSQELARKNGPKVPEDDYYDDMCTTPDLRSIYEKVLQESKRQWQVNQCINCTDVTCRVTGRSWCKIYSLNNRDRCARCGRKGHFSTSCKFVISFANTCCTFCYHPGCGSQLKLESVPSFQRHTHVCPAIGLSTSALKAATGHRHSGILFTIAHNFTVYTQFKRYLFVLTFGSPTGQYIIPVFDDSSISGEKSGENNAVLKHMFTVVDAEVPHFYVYHLAFDFWYKEGTKVYK